MYTFDYSSREKKYTGRTIDLEALQQKHYGGEGETTDENGKLTDEELEKKAKEESDRLEREAEEEALNSSMARAQMTPFERLVEKLSKKGLLEHQIVDFAQLIDINPGNNRSEFIWLIDQALSKPMPGWVYRVDPNGKWHYYTENSGAGEVAKGKREGSSSRGEKGISGWEADMNASLAQDDKQQQSTSKMSKYKSIQSVWNHPRAKFYKNLHSKLRKKRRLENREELASQLLKESTEDHIRRKHRGRQSGGVGVAHMAPKEGNENLVTQPTVWSFEQNTKIPSKKSVNDGYEPYDEETVKDVNGEASIKKRPNHPLHPGFQSNGAQDDNKNDDGKDGFLNEEDYLKENSDPFRSVTFDESQHNMENSKKKRRKRPDNKPGDGRNSERHSRENQGAAKGFTGLMVDATSPNRLSGASNENMVVDSSGNTIYMQPPKFAAMNNVAPRSTFEVDGSDSTDPEKGNRHVQQQRSNTVMGVHDEHLLAEKKDKKKKRKKKRKKKQQEKLKSIQADDDSEEDFSLLDDEDIKEGMRDINATEESTSWSMSTNTKISLKPLGLGLPSKIDVVSHPLEKIETPDISRKRFQPAKLDAMEEKHPLQLIESKLEQAGKKKKSSFNGAPLGQSSLLGGGGNSLSMGALGVGNGNLKDDEPYRIPSPREKRKRFQPAFGAMAPLGGAPGFGK